METALPSSPPIPDHAAPSRQSGRRPPSIARDLSRLRCRGRTDGVTLQQAVDSFAGRSTPLLLLFLGLLGFVPSPGLPLGMITGLAIICFAFGMLLRPGRPPIPAALARRHLSPGLLRRFMAFAIPFVRRLERWFRPRLRWAVSGLGLVLAALGIAVQAVGLALPLPFGNLPFALGIVLIALGLLTGDGLGALAGHAVGLASAAVFVGLGIGAVQAGHGLADYLPW
ncbi:exopolysaccharide biosynthesis protein [Ferrovibrio sp.]|uniref:exopolysaccharide biosynthesis protein n=1 Tax=Ferrovibrio sp. TaxID=1917215 RepID=UPI00311D7827